MGNPFRPSPAIASGEKSTVVILATDDLYLIHSPQSEYWTMEEHAEERRSGATHRGLESMISEPDRHNP